MGTTDTPVEWEHQPKYVAFKIVSAGEQLLVLGGHPVVPLPDGEPFFLLRGQDEFAAGIVEHYGRVLLAHDYSAEAVGHVFDHATAMRTWHVKKRPD